MAVAAVAGAAVVAAAMAGLAGEALVGGEVVVIDRGLGTAWRTSCSEQCAMESVWPRSPDRERLDATRSATVGGFAFGAGPTANAGYRPEEPIIL